MSDGRGSKGRPSNVTQRPATTTDIPVSTSRLTVGTSSGPKNWASSIASRSSSRSPTSSTSDRRRRALTGCDAEPRVRGHPARGVPIVKRMVHDDDGEPGELRAAHPPQQLLGLAGEHRAADHLEPAVRVPGHGSEPNDVSDATERMPLGSGAAPATDVGSKRRCTTWTTRRSGRPQRPARQRQRNVPPTSRSRSSRPSVAATSTISPARASHCSSARPHDPDWWIRRKIQTEQLTGLGPPALTLRVEHAELEAHLDTLTRESDVREHLEDFNSRVVEARRQLLGGPPVVTPTRDVDAEVAAWHERRAARLSAVAEAAELPAVPRRRRRRWRSGR